jgi:hypothetical protein
MSRALRTADPPGTSRTFGRDVYQTARSPFNDAAARLSAKELAQRSEYHVRELRGTAVLH